MDVSDSQITAYENLLRAAQAFSEDWEGCSVADALDPDLLDDVANTAEHAAAGGLAPVCGHTRTYSGRLRGDAYEVSSATCGRVAGHNDCHRAQGIRWTDSTPEWVTLGDLVQREDGLWVRRVESASHAPPG